MAAKAVVSEKHDGQESDKPKSTDAEINQPETAAASIEVGAAPPPAKSDRGGGRKRKRHLFNAIRTQMEFYFGDANLSKDRFLRRYVEQDPCKRIFIQTSFLTSTYIVVTVFRRPARHISNIQQNQDAHTRCAANIHVVV